MQDLPAVGDDEDVIEALCLLRPLAGVEEQRLAGMPESQPTTLVAGMGAEPGIVYVCRCRLDVFTVCASGPEDAADLAWARCVGAACTTEYENCEP